MMGADEPSGLGVQVVGGVGGTVDLPSASMFAGIVSTLIDVVAGASFQSLLW